MKSENMSSLSREDIDAMQLRKLNDLLAREKARQGFYRFLPASLNSIDGLNDLPFTTAADIISHGSDLLLAPSGKIARIISDTTSGTAGKRKRIYYSAQDIKDTVGFFSAGFAEAVSPGEKAIVALPVSAAGGLSDIIGEALAAIGVSAVTVGTWQTYAELTALISAVRPQLYVGMPVPFLSLLRMCRSQKIDCTFKSAVLSADTLPKSIEKIMTDDFGISLFPHYGSREMCFGGAITCAAHSGMHLRENHIIARITDENGIEVPDGTEGELVITTVGMRCFPLIRYKTGDIARFVPGSCSCGSATKRLENIRRIGENTDMAALDGALFAAADNLIDFTARRRGDELIIDAAFSRESSADKLTALLRLITDGGSFSVKVREITAGDRPFYTGKRNIIKET